MLCHVFGVVLVAGHFIRQPEYGFVVALSQNTGNPPFAFELDTSWVLVVSKAGEFVGVGAEENPNLGVRLLIFSIAGGVRPGGVQRL